MIDIKTAFFSLGFASFVFALLLSLTGRKSGAKRVITLLAWAKLGEGLAFLLLSGRGALPDILSKNIGNSLLFTGFALECIAAWVFVGKTRWKEVVLPVLAISILALNAGILPDPSDSIKTAAASLVVAMLMILCSMAFFQGGRNGSRLALIIGVADALVAAVNIARGARALTAPEFNLFSPCLIQYLAIGSLLLFVFANGFGFLLLINEEDHRQLKKSEERYRAIFASTMAVMLVIDPETGHIVDANGAAAAFYGYDPGRLRSMSIAEINHLDSETLYKEMEKDSRRTQGRFLFQHRLADGEIRDVEVYASPFESREKPLIVSIIHDITDRKRLEKERLDLERHLLKAEKAESLGRMAGAIAHHFNNQLSAVMGNLEMALRKSPAEAVIGKNLKDALRAAHRSSKMSRLMLTYLGQSPDKCEPMDLSEACRKNLPTIEDAIPKGVVFRADLLIPGPVVCANANQMRLILTHLITNAWESIENGDGAVTLATRVVPVCDIYASHLAPVGWKPARDSYACLEVRDTGGGVAEEDMERIFDPFFTTKFTGRGLGLAAILGIVKLWDGAIGVESGKDRGSAFRVLLPLATDAHPNRSRPFEKAAAIR